MTASDGGPFLHHIARSGIIKPLLMIAFRGQSNLKWEGRVPSELGTSKCHHEYQRTQSNNCKQRGRRQGGCVTFERIYRLPGWAEAVKMG